MHIGSILLSIQSLLCNNPLHNEPGFENEIGERNNLYNLIVEYNNYNYLILDNGFNIHSNFQIFEPIIKDHFIKEKINIINKLNHLAKKNSKKKISLNIYNILILIDYPNLKSKLSTKLDLL